MAAIAEIIKTGSGDWVDVETKVFGVDETLRAIAEVGGEVERAMAGALWREGQRILEASLKLVPYKTGNLAGTGHVASPLIEAGEVVVEIGYGGPAEPYALRQHEELGFKHRGKRQAKYLEQPFLQAIDTADLRMAQDIRDRASSVR